MLSLLAVCEEEVLFIFVSKIPQSYSLDIQYLYLFAFKILQGYSLIKITVCKISLLDVNRLQIAVSQLSLLEDIITH